MSEATAADVLVFGSGLTGSLVALDLCRGGRRTVIVDGGDEPGPSGHVPSGPALPYAQAVHRWGRDGARGLWELQREAHAELRTLLSGWAGDWGFRSAGGFLLAETRAEGHALADSEDLLRDDGFPGEFLDAYLFEVRFDVQGFAAAYWAEGEAELDGPAFSRAAAAAALEAGATLARSRPGEPADVSRAGVRAATTDGFVAAPVAVIAAAGWVSLAGGFFEGRVAPTVGKGRRWPLGEAALPSPVRMAAGGAGWTAVRDLVVEVTGDRDPASFAAAHFTRLPAAHEAAWSRPAAVSRDGLPWVGPIPDTPLVAALGGADDLGYAPLVARWAALSLLTGQDPTPAPLRATRSILA